MGYGEGISIPPPRVWGALKRPDGEGNIPFPYPLSMGIEYPLPLSMGREYPIPSRL